MRTIEELSEEVDLLQKKVQYVDGKEAGLMERVKTLEGLVAGLDTILKDFTKDDLDTTLVHAKWSQDLVSLEKSFMERMEKIGKDITIVGRRMENRYEDRIAALESASPSTDGLKALAAGVKQEMKLLNDRIDVICTHMDDLDHQKQKKIVISLE